MCNGSPLQALSRLTAISEAFRADTPAPSAASLPSPSAASAGAPARQGRSRFTSEWELASFVSRVPSNHGHIVWHSEASCQDIPPSLTRQSKQVSVLILGNPVQLVLSKKQLARVQPRCRPRPWRR